MLTLLKLFFACITAIGFKPMIYQDFNNCAEPCEDQVVEVECKNKRDYAEGNYDIYYYSLTDLFSPKFLGNVLNYCVNNGFSSDLLPSNTSTVFPTFNIIDSVTLNRNNLPINVIYYNSLGNTPVIIGQVLNFQLRKGVYQSVPFYLLNINWSDNGVISDAPTSITLEYEYFYDYNTYTYLCGGFLNSSASALSAYLFFGENYTSSPHFLYNMLTNDDEAEDTISWNKGYEYGYNMAYQDIQTDTDSVAYTSIFNQGKEQGIGIGYQQGYSEGLNYGLDQDSTAATIFTGILETGLLPINVFLKMFEYEVFGINIAGLVSGFLTIALIMIFVRFIFGGKENG